MNITIALFLILNAVLFILNTLFAVSYYYGGNDKSSGIWHLLISLIGLISFWSVLLNYRLMAINS